MTERERLELGEQIEFMALHPRLCEDDGERLLGHILCEHLQFITPACAEQRQQKLLRDGFQKAGPMDRQHWIPVSMAKETTDMGKETTDTVFEKFSSAGLRGVVSISKEVDKVSVITVFGDLLLGGVSHVVARRSEAPVLLIPPPR